MKAWFKGGLFGLILFIVIFTIAKTFHLSGLINSNFVGTLFWGCIIFIITFSTIWEFVKSINNPPISKSKLWVLIGLLISFISLIYGLIDTIFHLYLSGGDGYLILILIYPVIIGIVVFIIGLIGWIIGKIKLIF